MYYMDFTVNELVTSNSLNYPKPLNLAHCPLIGNSSFLIFLIFICIFFHCIDSIVRVRVCVSVTNWI